MGDYGSFVLETCGRFLRRFLLEMCEIVVRGFDLSFCWRFLRRDWRLTRDACRVLREFLLGTYNFAGFFAGRLVGDCGRRVKFLREVLTEVSAGD